jgi:integrase
MSSRKPKKRKGSLGLQAELPLPHAGETPGLGQLVDWYLRKHVVQKAKLTQKSMRSTFRLLQGQFHREARLMPGDVRDWLCERIERNEILPGTANLTMAHVHHMYEVARKERWPLLLNAGTGTRFAKVPEKPKALKEPQETWPRLLAAMPDDVFRAFLCVMRNLGLRLAEACGLEPKHIHLNAPSGPELRLEQQRHGKDTKPNLKMNGRPRSLPLDEETARYLKASLKERLKDGPGQSKARCFLFPWGEDTLQHVVNLMRQVSPEDFPKRVSGVQAGAAFHVLRHTCAADLVKAGLGDREIMEWLGHRAFQGDYYQDLRGGTVSAGAQNKMLQHLKRTQAGESAPGITTAKTGTTPGSEITPISTRRNS